MYHSLSWQKVIETLKTDTQKGLTETEVQRRLLKFGPNSLPAEKPLSKLNLFLGQFKNPLVYILLTAGLISLVFKNFTDVIIILATIILNAVLGFSQEYKADQAFRGLKKILKVKTRVFRDNQEKEIFQEHLAPGDIFLLKAGDKVPADGRLIEARDLKINESILTGEWLAEEKIIEPMDKETPLADRRNMVYAGCLVEGGQAKAVVTATGLTAELGQITQTLQKIKPEKTPLQKKLVDFSRLIGLIVIAISTVILIQGLINGRDFLEIFTTAAAVAVASVPESLPAAITLILALGMTRILKKKGLIRKLSSLEALGSTSIILTDKTGTLTEAKMEVSGIFTTTTDFFHRGKDSAKIEKDGLASHILALKMATLTREAFVENLVEPMEKWLVRGRPTERALLLAGIQTGLDKMSLEKEQPKIDYLPFSPIYKYSASLHYLSPSENIFYVMGAPEIILDKSKHLHLDGHEELLDRQKLEKLEKKFSQLTEKGQRVVGLAYKKTDQDKIGRDLFHELVFVGFIALHDPIRKDVREAIKACQQAGIKPIILTGDHHLTAQAVARELGLKIQKENILEGKELEKLSNEELEKQLTNIKIYARVEPKQKLRIVEAWQKRGEIVAVTGDGINDVLALKKSDIGIALGSGTDIAKEVSGLVLLNDSFSVIIAAIEEGRRIIDNIRKTIAYLLSGGFTEIILISGSLFFDWPLPVLASQILWINLIEDGLPALTLGFEPKEKKIMQNKPQKTHEIALLTNQMKTLIFIVGIFTDILTLILFFWLLKFSGYNLEHIRSLMFAALSIDSLFFLFSFRSLKRNIWQINFFSNKILIISWFFGIIMLLAGIYLTPLQAILKTQPLNFFDWQIILILGLINLILIELTKWFFIRQETPARN